MSLMVNISDFIIAELADLMYQEGNVINTTQQGLALSYVLFIRNLIEENSPLIQSIEPYVQLLELDDQDDLAENLRFEQKGYLITEIEGELTDLLSFTFLSDIFRYSAVARTAQILGIPQSEVDRLIADKHSPPSPGMEQPDRRIGQLVPQQLFPEEQG